MKNFASILFFVLFAFSSVLFLAQGEYFNALVLIGIGVLLGRQE